MTNSAYAIAVSRACSQFRGAIDEHEMTVLLDTLDDGTPYRHVRFAQPGTSIWSFNLVTWPGHLSISGDLHSYTFRRLHDMFDFFRGRSINPSYWSEKLVAEHHGTEYGKSRYSEDQFVETLTNHVTEVCEWLTKADAKRFRKAIDDDVLEYGAPASYEEARAALEQFHWRSEEPGSRYARGFSFQDIWDWHLGGFDHHFLLACHAIQWGVGKYLTAHPGRFIPEGGTRPAIQTATLTGAVL